MSSDQWNANQILWLLYIFRRKYASSQVLAELKRRGHGPSVCPLWHPRAHELSWWSIKFPKSFSHRTQRLLPYFRHPNLEPPNICCTAPWLSYARRESFENKRLTLKNVTVERQTNLSFPPTVRVHWHWMTWLCFSSKLLVFPHKISWRLEGFGQNKSKVVICLHSAWG